MRAAEAVNARIELDLRIGAVFTRFQSINLKDRFLNELSHQKVISYGTCQFPTLGFVVDKYLRAKEFVIEDFWHIDVSLKKDGMTTKFLWDRDRLFDHHFTVVLYEKCMENPTARVIAATSNPKSKWRPLPLTTIEMQKMATKHLRMTSDVVMAVADKLYQKGILSYPRTETNCFAPNFELKALVEKQVNDPKYREYAVGLLDGKFKWPRVGKDDDHAHPPIHPVRADMTLKGDELKLFDFVTRHFLACCSEDAKGHATNVTIEIAGEKFKAGGLAVLNKNYLEIYTFDYWNGSNIAAYNVGEMIQPTALLMVDGKTTRPTLLTETELIAIMHARGIGTDATVHEHIKKILDRDYANRDGNIFKPTVLGMALVTGYDKMNIDISLSKPDLRAIMETEMKKICDGLKSRQAVVDEMADLYKQAFLSAQQQLGILVSSCAHYLQ